MKLKKIFSLLFFLIVSNSLFAQEPVSVHLTEADGLPDIEFYDILEDAQGFIWLAADKGLYRYDGKEYLNFSHPQKKGLSVFGLTLDASGRLWCYNLSGQVFYVVANELILFLDLKESKLINDASFFQIKMFNDKLIVLTTESMYAISFESKHIEELNLGNNTSSYFFSEIVNDSLFFADRNKLYAIGKDAKKIKQQLHYIELKPKQVLLSFNFNNTLFIRERNRNLKIDEALYYKAKNGITAINIPNRLKNTKIENVNMIDNSLWFATNAGVFVFDFISNKLVFKAHFFENEIITKVIEDNNNTIWISTLKNGIYVIPNVYLKQYKLSQALMNIASLEAIDANSIAFGTNNGVVGFYNFDTQNFTSEVLEKKAAVNKLCFNPYKNTLYISPDNDESYSYNFESKTLEKSPYNYIYSNAKGFSLIDANHLLYSNHFAASILSFSNDKVQTEKLSYKGRSYAAYYSKALNKKYVSFVSNLLVFDNQNKSKIIAYKGQAIFATDIAETSDGIVWIATFKDGVFGLKNDKVFINLNEDNGLFSNKVSLLKQDKDKLWIVNDKAVQRYDTQTKTFRNLTKRDALNPNTISAIEVLDGKVVFGTNKGLFAVANDKVFKEQQISIPYFTKITIADSLQLHKMEYSLSPKQHKITIAFNSNGFKSLENNTYRYRLLGNNDTWHKTQLGVNEVTYNILPQGDYVFELQTLVGGKTSKSISLPIRVNAYFFKQTWFIILSFFLIALALTWFYQYKLKLERVKQKEALAKKQQAYEKTFLKLENLRSQMNPHFIFNSLNSIQDYIITNNKELAGDYLGKFADLIRLYLDHSTKGEITLTEEIAALKGYLELEKMRFEDKLNYIINVDKSIYTDEVLIPTMLVQPYIENAIKHGIMHKHGKGTIQVSFAYDRDDNYVHCIIEDNGVGRKKAQEIKAKFNRNHKSFATKATANRLELLNQDTNKRVSVTSIDLEDNGKAVGTRVEISIPFKLL